MYEVSTSRLLDRDVIEVTLDSSSSRLARPSGQFACVTFDERANPGTTPVHHQQRRQGTVRFSIKGSGDFTNALLSGVPDGSQLRIEGPYGAFVNDGAALHQLWLAGGIGITPFLSMAEDLDDQAHVLLVWSVHDEQEAIYRRRSVACCRGEAEPQRARAFDIRTRTPRRQYTGPRSGAERLRSLHLRTRAHASNACAATQVDGSLSQPNPLRGIPPSVKSRELRGCLR